MKCKGTGLKHKDSKRKIYKLCKDGQEVITGVTDDIGEFLGIHRDSIYRYAKQHGYTLTIVAYKKYNC
ncbi:MAG: hypothetical protein OEV44_02815 [Spirochaetota bacterium]|nr:hypothetical protein [Spirochaetota bacterium]